MSKAEGKKIAIKFSLPINSVVVNEIIENGEFETPQGTITASSTYQNNYPTRLLDNNVGTMWYTRNSGAQWVLVNLTTPKNISGVRFYSNGYSRPNEVNFYGSSDNVNYDLIKTTTNVNSEGWKEHNFETIKEYKYVKMEIISRYESYLGIGELKFKYAVVSYSSGIEEAFTITGNEYEYTDGPNNNGPLITRSYGVNLVQTHPTESNSIQIYTDIFRNSQGPVTLSYDQALGNLSGQGGAIASFTESFIPEGLLEQGNPRIREYIEASVSGSIELIEIEKISTYNTEYIAASVGGAIQLIHIDDINP
jgi:hypothetical protein